MVLFVEQINNHKGVSANSDKQLIPKAASFPWTLNVHKYFSYKPTANKLILLLIINNMNILPWKWNDNIRIL